MRVVIQQRNLQLSYPPKRTHRQKLHTLLRLMDTAHRRNHLYRHSYRQLFEHIHAAKGAASPRTYASNLIFAQPLSLSVYDFDRSQEKLPLFYFAAFTSYCAAMSLATFRTWSFCSSVGLAPVFRASM